MATRAEFIAAARSMLGTRFVHQGRQPAAGVDCIGLLICAAKMIGINLIDHTTYGRNPNPRQLLGKFEENAMLRFEPGDIDPLPGDLLLFFNKESAGPQHLALAAEGRDGYALSMIHTSNDLKKVVENPYADPWPASLHSVWRLSQLED